MRPKHLLLLVGLSLAGCASFSERYKAAAPQPKTSVTAEKFFAHWNDNSRRIQSLRCDLVDVDGRSQGQPYSLKAKLAYQQPQRFRMLGKFAGKSEVDLGSNEQEIWFWIARAEPPAVYFCKRDELARVKLSTPFQPDWIIEALGVTPLDPDAFQETPGSAEYLLLVSNDKNLAGQPIIKRVVVDRRTNRVEAFELFSADRKALARAQITEYQEDPATGLFFPRRINIDWPDAETRLSIALSKRHTAVNALAADDTARLFFRGPNDYSNTQVVDLARIGQERGPRPRPEELRDVAGGPPARRYDERVQPARAAAELTGQIEPAANRPRLGAPVATER